MSPKQILSILWRRAWIIGLAFASTMAGAGGIMLLVPSRYDAVATATIDPGQADPVTGQSMSGTMLSIAQGNMVALAGSERVAVEVVNRLNLTRDPVMISAYQRSGSNSGIAEWIASGIILKGTRGKVLDGLEYFEHEI